MASSTASVLIATYGEDEWRDLAWSRAFPSAKAQAEDVSCFHDPEGTIASVRNEMANTARGEWLLFLDADDELAPGYLDAMTRAVERVGDGPALLTPAVQLIRKGRASEPAFFDKGIPLWAPPGEPADNWLVLGTLVQRELFLRVGGFDDEPHGYEDWSCWAKCVKSGAEIVKVPDAVYRYFHNPQSKHKIGWRDTKWQKENHLRVQAQLHAWVP